MHETTWIFPSLRDEIKSLASELQIPYEIAQILANREIYEIEDARKFLFGTIEDLHDPYLMRGMKEAVERIRVAVSKNEKILIFGDYDVDGILSVVILSKALESFGAEVDYFIPERLKEGYGIKEKHIEVVSEKGASLVISVDCGIKALPFVKLARERGIDVIITDHHLPGPILPEAVAILNPVLQDSGYPSQYLAGIGVVFKLVQALLERESGASSLPHYLKLVSIGTIADVAELRGENRIFVKIGLKALENASNIGLLSLIDTCGLKGKSVSVGDVGFRIGPRINAAGRMGKTDLAVRLFFTHSYSESLDIVNHLEQLNSERQKTEKRIYTGALSQVQDKSLDKRHKFLVLGCEEWHRGVMGIVASRLKDFFHRPVLLFSYEDGKAFGSGRSISEFSMIQCLEECEDFFLSYGGHDMAVGCVLDRKNMNAFKEALNTIASLRLSDEDMKRKIFIDSDLDFPDINSFFIEGFLLLSPFGVGNPRPIFLTREAEVLNEPRKIHGKHSKFLLRQKGKVFEAIGWNRSNWAETVRRGDRIDLVYTLQFSEFRGEKNLILSLEDIKI